LGVQYSTRDYIGKLYSQVDRSLILNLNNIFYILVTAQYFKTSLGNTFWTYQGSLPKTPQPPDILKLASITTDCERYSDLGHVTLHWWAPRRTLRVQSLTFRLRYNSISINKSQQETYDITKCEKLGIPAVVLREEFNHSVQVLLCP